MEALKLSLKVSKSLFDSRRFGLGSLLFFLFCFSVLVFGSDRKRKKSVTKQTPHGTPNGIWDPPIGQTISSKPLLFPFYRFISSVYQFSSIISKISPDYSTLEMETLGFSFWLIFRNGLYHKRSRIQRKDHVIFKLTVAWNFFE